MSKLRTTPMRLLTETESAYIAGILDGEGTITISKKKDRETRPGYCFRPYISVGNTNRLLLTWLAERTGLGSIHPYSQRNPKHKPAWRWDLWSNQARQLLGAVQPFLLLKKEQAVLLLRFCAAKRDGVGRSGLSAEEWATQEQLTLQIRTLNKRGAA